MTFHHPRGALGFHQWTSTDEPSEDSCIGCGTTTVNFGEAGSVIVDYSPLPIMCPGPGESDTHAHHFGESYDPNSERTLECHFCGETITENTDPDDVDWTCRREE